MMEVFLVLQSLLAECDDPLDETPDFPRLQLCSDRIDAYGVYLMDKPDLILVYVCRSVAAHFCQNVLGVNGYASLMEMVTEREQNSNNFQTMPDSHFTHYLLSE